ncbi:MAG: hypothetical protein AAFY07_14535, partial [Pseudomonadota bacterium]
MYYIVQQLQLVARPAGPQDLHSPDHRIPCRSHCKTAGTCFVDTVATQGWHRIRDAVVLDVVAAVAEVEVAVAAFRTIVSNCSHPYFPVKGTTFLVSFRNKSDF